MDRKMENILVIHGPNLNLLGEREVEVYGSQTLEELNREIHAYAQHQHLELRFYQSNHEGHLIDFLHENRNWAHGIVINPGALTHYSYALRDALSGIGLPAVEVHLSNIHEREDFRKISVIESVCIRQIVGLGHKGYFEAIETLLKYQE